MSMGERYQVRLYCFEELVKEGASLPEVETSLLTPEDMCMICYTSGTTGVPKGALLTHGNMIAVSTAVVQYIDTIGGLTNEDIHMSYLPMAHVFGALCAVCYCLLRSANWVLSRRHDKVSG